MEKQSKTNLKVLRASFFLMLLIAVFFTAPTMSVANSQFIPVRGMIAPPSGANDLCATYKWACAKSRGGRTLTDQELKVVKDINKKVNRQVHSISDQAQYKNPEVWALPTNRGGDCEDFALLKKRELIGLGIDPSHLLLATVHDRRQGAHAVLIVRSGQGDLVLDNLTNRIRTWQDTQYTFLRMQNPATPTKWVAVFAGG